MDLPWGFYRDSWLIDPYPNEIEIVVKKDEKGKFYPSPGKVVLFFGANPKYIYGEGKYEHEVFISPTGTALYPEFSETINGDFIRIDNIVITTVKEYDFDGRLNYDKFFGDVDPLLFLENVQKKVYKLSQGKFSTNFTPSPFLREATDSELLSKVVDSSKFSIYENAEQMANDGCLHYWKMDIQPSLNENTVSIDDKIGGMPLKFITNYSINYQIFDEVSTLDITRGYLQVSRSILNSLKNGFYLMFKTLPNLKFGKVFSFGIENINGKYYGCEFYINETSISFVANNEDQRIWEKTCSIDWSFSQKVGIYFKHGILKIIVSKITLIDEEVSTNISFFENNIFVIAGKIISERRSPSRFGNISEFAIFDGDDNVGAEKFVDTDKVFIRSSYLPTVQEEDGTPIISDNLTFKDDRMFFLPNYGDSPKFKEIQTRENYNVDTKQFTSEEYYNIGSTSQRNNVFRLYAIDSSGYKTVLKKVPDNLRRQQDRPEDIIIANKLYRIPKRTRFFGIIIGNDYTGRKFNSLTKLTSDTHYPLRIEIDISVPDYFKVENTYKFKLKLTSLDSFLYYNYAKFRDKK